MFYAALFVTASEGFAPCHNNYDWRCLYTSCSRSTTSLNLVSTPPPPRDDGGNDAPRDYNPEEEFNLDDTSDSQIDWDSEWKKVVREQETGKSAERPDGGYKSEAEIAAIRAANKATEQLNRAAQNVPSLPTWDTLKGDWKVRALFDCFGRTILRWTLFLNS